MKKLIFILLTILLLTAGSRVLAQPREVLPKKGVEASVITVDTVGKRHYNLNTLTKDGYSVTVVYPVSLPKYSRLFLRPIGRKQKDGKYKHVMVEELENQ